MKIEKIKALPNGKYRLTFDNDSKLTTYDDVIIINHLLYDKTVDAELFNKIQIDTSHFNLFNKVIKFINTRMRSEKEVDVYLDKLSATNEEKKTIVDKLKNIGLINDISFSKAFFYDKMNLTNFGPYKIKKDLLSNNISEEIIDELIYKYPKEDINQKLYRIITKRVASSKNHSSYMLKQKIIIDMINLGYEKDMINEILSNIDIPDDERIEIEYNKIYNKLSKKYSGNELYYKIKQKLYAKGFNINEINEYLNKKIEIE